MIELSSSLDLQPTSKLPVDSDAYSHAQKRPTSNDETFPILSNSTDESKPKVAFSVFSGNKPSFASVAALGWPTKQTMCNKLEHKSTMEKSLTTAQTLPLDSAVPLSISSEYTEAVHGTLVAQIAPAADIEASLVQSIEEMPHTEKNESHAQNDDDDDFVLVSSEPSTESSQPEVESIESVQEMDSCNSDTADPSLSETPSPVECVESSVADYTAWSYPDDMSHVDSFGKHSSFPESFHQRPHFLPPLCRYFHKGRCYAGPSCRFGHMIGNEMGYTIFPTASTYFAIPIPTTSCTQVLNPDKPKCKYFGEGRCWAGQFCRFAHYPEDQPTTHKEQS